MGTALVSRRQGERLNELTVGFKFISNHGKIYRRKIFYENIFMKIKHLKKLNTVLLSFLIKRFLILENRMVSKIPQPAGAGIEYLSSYEKSNNDLQ
ncbi:MAG: hypothetical protein IPL83_16080 [Bdellovibrionales bacterium]|nr:hypothetical protein [Bdellovibrionales bacterium]